MLGKYTGFVTKSFCVTLINLLNGFQHRKEREKYAVMSYLSHFTNIHILIGFFLGPLDLIMYLFIIE